MVDVTNSRQVEMQMLKTTAGKLLAVVLKTLWIRREIILHLQLHSKAKTQNWQVENDCQFQIFLYWVHTRMLLRQHLSNLFDVRVNLLNFSFSA
jgi:hypothetical protein